MSPRLLALFTAFSYAGANVLVRRGLVYSTPAVATLVSLITQASVLWAAVVLGRGVPEVASAAIVAIALAGILQVFVRLCHYTGIDKVGTSRAVTLRATHPIYSVFMGILFLGEPVSPQSLVGTVLIVAGTIATSWKAGEPTSTFRRWYLLFPLGTALLTGITHPIRRYAMRVSPEPLFFAAFVVTVSLCCFATYLSLGFSRESVRFHPRAVAPFVTAGLFEAFAVLLMLTAFVSGPVVYVSPIVATSPIWTLLIGAVFLRHLERVNIHMVVGTLSVVVGVISVYLAD